MQIAVFTAAIFSFIGDIVLFLTFFVSKKWRLELTLMKKIILVLAVYHMFYLLAYIDVNSTNSDAYWCQIQASLIQFFGVGTILYEAVVAIECYALCLSVFKGDVVYTHKESEEIFPCLKKGCGEILNYMHLCLSSRQCQRRHFFYHTFVFLYSFVSTLLMNLYHYYGTSDRLDMVCWIQERSFNILFGVAPMVVSILIVITFNSRVVYLIVSALGERATDSTITSRLNEPSTIKEFIHDKISDIRDAVTEVHCHPENLPDIVAEEARRIPLVRHGALFVGLFSRLSPRAKNAFLRLIAIPVCFVVMGIPGVVRRFMVMRGYQSSDTLNIVTLVCATMGGVINCIIWVLSDSAVRMDWAIFMKRGWYRLCHFNFDFSVDCEIDCDASRISSFSGPLSEYSEHDPEEFITRDRESLLQPGGRSGTVSLDQGNKAAAPISSSIVGL